MYSNFTFTTSYIHADYQDARQTYYQNMCTHRLLNMCTDISVKNGNSLHFNIPSNCMSVRAGAKCTDVQFIHSGDGAQEVQGTRPELGVVPQQLPPMPQLEMIRILQT